MTPAEQMQMDRVTKSLGDKPEGALVEITAADLASLSNRVMAVWGLDRATIAIAQSFAKGAAAVKPHQVVFVLAEQLRQVLAELQPPPPEPEPEPEAEPTTFTSQRVLDEYEQSEAEEDES